MAMYKFTRSIDRRVVVQRDDTERAYLEREQKGFFANSVIPRTPSGIRILYHASRTRRVDNLCQPVGKVTDGLSNLENRYR